MTWTEPRHRWAVELPTGKLLTYAEWRCADDAPLVRTFRVRRHARPVAKDYGGKAVRVDVLYRRAATGKKRCGESDCERPGECDGRCERWP